MVFGRKTIEREEFAVPVGGYVDHPGGAKVPATHKWPRRSEGRPINAWDHGSGYKEAEMGVIPAAVGTLSGNYPRRDKKNPALYQYVQQVMRGLPGTPCCVQMSHALNMSGIPIPANSYRRRNTPLTINGTVYYYILATDELEKFLFDCCGDDGETINKDLGKTRFMGEIKTYISSRPGLLLFRYSNIGVPAPPGEFEHTELWGYIRLTYHGARFRLALA